MNVEQTFEGRVTQFAISSLNKDIECQQFASVGRPSEVLKQRVQKNYRLQCLKIDTIRDACTGFCVGAQ